MNLYALVIVFTSKFVPFLLALIGFGFLITIHELGHFIFCKIFGIHTPTFSIGMGPTIFEKTFGKTNFRLAVIPIGGYVEIAGLAEVGQGEQEHADIADGTAFSSKPYWQKMLVLLGGIFFNFLFAYCTFIGLHMSGIPEHKAVDVLVASVKNDSPAAPLIKAGDKVIAIDNTSLSAAPKLLSLELQEIALKLEDLKKDNIVITIERNKELIKASIPLKAEDVGKKSPLEYVQIEIKPTKTVYTKLPFLQAVKAGFNKTNEWTLKIIDGLKSLFVSRNLKQFGGPIMIMSESFKQAKAGIRFLLVFLSIISINLAVVNILPIGALDGGQVLFETVEVIIRRKIPESVRLWINLISWLLIITLILVLSYQDIMRFFR